MVDEITLLKGSLDRLHATVVELDLAVTKLELRVKQIKARLGMEG